MSNDTPSLINMDERAAALYPDLAENDLKRVGPKAPTSGEKAEADQMAKLFPKMAEGLARRKSHRDDLERGQRQAVDEAIAQEKAEREGRQQMAQQKEQPKNEKAADTTELSPVVAELFSEVKLPEGFEINPEMAEDFAEVADGLGLDKSAVAALVKYDVERQGQMQQAMIEAQDNQIAEWAEQSTEKFSEDELKQAAQAFQAIASDELMELVNQIGIGSHPALIEFALKLSEIAEDGRIGQAFRRYGNR